MKANNRGWEITIITQRIRNTQIQGSQKHIINQITQQYDASYEYRKIISSE